MGRVIRRVDDEAISIKIGQLYIYINPTSMLIPFYSRLSAVHLGLSALDPTFAAVPVQTMYGYEF